MATASLYPALVRTVPRPQYLEAVRSGLVPMYPMIGGPTWQTLPFLCWVSMFNDGCIVIIILIIVVYDRKDAAATINFGTQFGTATIRERCLLESGVRRGRVGTGRKNNTHTDSVTVVPPSGVRVYKHQRFGCSLAESASSA